MRGIIRQANRLLVSSDPVGVHGPLWFKVSLFYLFLGSQLNAQLEDWLSKAQSTRRPARAIIAP